MVDVKTIWSKQAEDCDDADENAKWDSDDTLYNLYKLINNPGKEGTLNEATRWFRWLAIPTPAETLPKGRETPASWNELSWDSRFICAFLKESIQAY